MAKKKDNRNVKATNRKARHEYDIIDTVEAGMVLKGTEIKSIRDSRINIQDGFASVENGEMYLFNVHISPYEAGNRYNVDPIRKRKLLLHQNQINKLNREIQQAGMTLVPLRVYIKNGFAKILIGLAKGKKQHDKREDLKRREQERDIDRAMKSYS
ncbi:MAG: SsrA-binding protein SmpB [Atopococcus tabaci]|uniref:SsrA-binding protein n=1 Tax=Atopococcus tabaci TaxID=269774 RepID=A0AA43UCD9_9LACT|nr:SsrA-binding protein SmpB [Atopococcus tabaci]